MEKKNYKKPPNYTFGEHGSACFLEPPGHPRYFTRSIFTQYGNCPTRGSQYYFNCSGFDSLEEVDKYFKPLPYDHPRVKAWESYAYAYFKNSYSPDGEIRDVSKSMNQGPPQYHLAYLLVKKYYPEAKPQLDQIEKPVAWGKGGVGSWWETMDERPTPEKCPGDGESKHPVNVTWCQVCGWVRPQ